MSQVSDTTKMSLISSSLIQSDFVPLFGLLDGHFVIQVLFSNNLWVRGHEKDHLYNQSQSILFKIIMMIVPICGFYLSHVSRSMLNYNSHGYTVDI